MRKSSSKVRKLIKSFWKTGNCWKPFAALVAGSNKPNGEKGFRCGSFSKKSPKNTAFLSSDLSSHRHTGGPSRDPGVLSVYSRTSACKRRTLAAGIIRSDRQAGTFSSALRLRARAQVFRRGSSTTSFQVPSHHFLDQRTRKDCLRSLCSPRQTTSGWRKSSRLKKTS